ncbi:hypothetical protein DCC85_12090 [Paenibacillus sp. CAA11]|uniref:YdcF family protein n=1 Tax=Paenibacillus sp. CAA11 TaxID=1532905 RepID=UPI000D394892|nr:YdcF family protein [Paenibacillus sp. CAA11]AWB44887.1 hypothetical protein DCC85_12090 [Paenibacillus sp. CAA11]
MNNSAESVKVPPRTRKAGPARQLVKAAGLIILLGLVWLAYAWLQIESGKSTKSLKPADVGIVLGASLWNDVPSPGLKERLNLAAQLYSEGKFPYILVTGGLDSPKAKRTEAQGMALYLTELGIPKEAILLENQATSTVENLKFSKQIMKEHHFNTAVIITHNYHGRRALEIARTLDYKDPQLSLTDSKVLNMGYNKAREILAYTKWKMDQALILIRGE